MRMQRRILFKAALVVGLGIIALGRPAPAAAYATGGEGSACFVCDPELNLFCPTQSYMDGLCGTTCGVGRTMIGTCTFQGPRCQALETEWQCSN